MSKYCPKCGKALPDDANFCTNCGYEFASRVLYNVPPVIEKKPIPGRKFGIASMIIGLSTYEVSLFSAVMLFINFEIYAVVTTHGGSAGNTSFTTFAFFLAGVIAVLSLLAIIFGHMALAKKYKKQAIVGLISGYLNLAQAILSIYLTILLI